MPEIPIIPENAPFTPEQRSWLNGFLAAWIGEATGQAIAAEEPAGAPLLILFGSQSGNAEGLAKKIGKQAAAKGFAPRVAGMDAVQPADLAKESQTLVITSTWGEGEMPDNAKDFWEGINNGSSPDLKGMSYSVLALGDTNYGDTFCYAGKVIDERFEKLGAKRIHPRADCDVDFDEPAEEWLSGVMEKLDSTAAAAPATATADVATEAKTEEGYSKKNPFPSKLLENRKLNKEGSAKDVRHIAFSLEGSGLVYEAGDALGVQPVCDPEDAQILITALGCDASNEVEIHDGSKISIRTAFTENYDITKITPAMLKLIAGLCPDSELPSLLDKSKKKELADYLWTRYPVDLIREFKPEGLEVDAFVESLKKLQIRLYSIASSPKAHEGEVHLTVGAVRYSFEDEQRGGVCSTLMADRLALGNTTGVFVQTSHGFRLPENMDLPVIMVGPGTGIAPFRAFLEERAATEAKGKNWLFFGDQKSTTDFLYQEQLEEYFSSGVLNRLDLAFSRDQAEKIYVQDRMKEKGAELWQWLQDGAHFYVCGDASRMAKDVDAMLHEIARTHGRLDEAGAKAYIKQLKSDKRYQRDVY
ncbi:MAG: sulfite reductase subunit alpha [Verrucomicrobiota bacterium]